MYNPLNPGKAVLTCTNNLCFGAKIRKIGLPLHTPVLLYKVGFKGVDASRTCFRDVNEPSHEKANNLGFQLGCTQTSLYSDRRQLESQRACYRVWEINIGVCPRMEFYEIMCINCLGYGCYDNGVLPGKFNSTGKL